MIRLSDPGDLLFRRLSRELQELSWRNKHGGHRSEFRAVVKRQVAKRQRRLATKCIVEALVLDEQVSFMDSLDSWNEIDFYFDFTPFG